MPITATVIRDGRTISTTGTLIEMTAQCGGAAAVDGQQHLDMLVRGASDGSLEESRPCTADQIGHLQGRPAHLASPGGSSFVLCPSAPTRPEDWPWRQCALRKVQVNRAVSSKSRWPRASGWCAGPRPLPVDEWRNNGDYSACGIVGTIPSPGLLRGNLFPTLFFSS